MAADNRNFVNKFANEGGGDVLVEDKRLEELKSATAKTSSQISTSTDYIPLQDTDGNLVKINAASFQEAVRNTLGGLLANNDKGTTISGIPALSGSGASLDFGSVSPANLASVLGVGSAYQQTVGNSFSQFRINRLPTLVYIYWMNSQATKDYEHIYIIGEDGTVINLKDSNIYDVEYSNGYLNVKSKNFGAYGTSIYMV